MLALYVRIVNWFRGEEGQDLIEYSLLAGFIALALIALLPATRTFLQTMWTTINSMLGSAVPGT